MLLLGKLLWFHGVSWWIIGGAALALFALGLALEKRKLVPVQVLFVRILFFSTLLAIATGLGWFVYPSALASRFGDVLPDLLRRIAWGELLLFAMLFIRLVRRPITICRSVSAGKGWVMCSGPPFPEFFKYTIGVLCAIIVMAFYAFNFFGLMIPRSGTEGQIWFFFIIVSVAGFAACSRALDIMLVIDKNIKEVDQYLGKE